jgi:hypothetical protein
MEADAHGRFSIPLLDAPVQRLEISLRDPAWTASLLRVETGIDATLGADLGNLELERVRRVAFVALDGAGRPIEGAVAVADDGTGAKSRPTDQDGRSELRGLDGDTFAMVVWAHRYVPTEVALPEQLPERLDVVLLPAASLDVRVLLPDGEPARHVIVSMSTEEALFERPERMLAGGVSVLPEATAFEVGTTRPTGASFRSDTASQTIVVGSITYAPDRNGLVTLSGLRAEVPFTLAVQDVSGSPVWGPETLRLRRGELRDVRAQLPYESVDLDVRVRDGNRLPLSGAKVTVTAGSGAVGNTGRTGADGIARFPGLYAGRVEVSVELSGYAISVLTDTGLPPTGVPLDVTLLPGLDVTVQVRSTTGETVAADKVWAVVGQRTVSRDETPAVGNALPPGALFGSQWVLAGLPDQQVVLRARLGQRIVEVAHDPRMPVATITVDG